MIGSWPVTVQRARDLVMEHGWNATAYQIVNPGIDLWFAARGDAVIGYVRGGGMRVAAGAPVCALERLADVADEFERDARRAGERVCYFGAEDRLEALYARSSRHARALLGAQPAWEPGSWVARLEAHRSLRAQLHRARNKGVRVEEWSPERATGSPALRAVLEQWCAQRSLPPLHFLVEPDTLDRLDDRRIFVATRAGHEREPGDRVRIVAFAIASPVPLRHGWLVEQFPRTRGAPNGTIETLLDAAVRAMAAAGDRYVTLGLSPLSRAVSSDSLNEPAWLRLLLRWARAHGRRFYNFGGLEAFKAKFRPERWEAVYAIENARQFTPRAMYAIAAAFGGRSPLALIPAILWRDAWREVRWHAHDAPTPPP